VRQPGNQRRDTDILRQVRNWVSIGKLHSLHGMGDKSEARLLEGVEAIKPKAK
jgi:hypothetical protein